MVWNRLRKVGACALLSVGVAGAWSEARAQTPASAAPVHAGKIYAKATTLDIPVDIPEGDRKALKQVCLFVKSGTGDWYQHEASTPQVTRFQFKAVQDGEYSFSIVTQDQAGKINPPDISRLALKLTVVVDTRPPELEVQQWVTPDEGECCLKCVMVDANPNYASLRMRYRGQGGQDHTIDQMPNRPGVFRLPMETFDHPVHVIGKDLAGHEVIKEHIVKSPMPIANRLPVGEPGVVPAGKNEPPTVAPPPRVDNPALSRGELSSTKGGTPPPLDAKGIETTADPGPSPFPPGMPISGSARSSLDPASGNRRLISTTKASLDYRVDQVGLSGIGKVEVYATTDQGASWQRLGEDPDKRSPVEVSFPGDGVYGIRLVVTNGNGFGGAAPAKGDQPTSIIEVDTSAPYVQLRDIEPTTRDGCLEIRWKASDKNLSNEPVTLLYRTRPDMPWAVIARNVKNDGLHRWAFPRDMGSQFFVKIEVADQAGNVARIESPNPVTLDMTVPSAEVVNVSGIQSRGSLE